MLTIRPEPQIAGPLDFLQSVGSGLVHAVEQLPGAVADTLQMGCKLAQSVPAAAAGPYAAYAAAAQAGCGLLAPGQVPQGANAGLPQQAGPQQVRVALPAAVYSKYPAGSIARWNPRKKQWWIFYPGNPTTLGDTLGAVRPNGFHLINGLGAPNGFHLLSDPTPDAVETGTETQQPAGTQKGPDVKTPFYKKWETYAIAGGAVAVGGVVLWLVLR